MSPDNFKNSRARRALALVITLLAIAGCQSPVIQKIATRYGLQLDTVTVILPMRIIHRQPEESAPAVRLYLGGDGTPWRNGQPANNPTGSGLPLGMRLFLRDPLAHGYIGRPCYHFTEALPPGCTSALWTSHRYSDKVVAALSEQVMRLSERYDRRDIELVGHSGGGTLALLVAARVTAVKKVVTLSAVLDPHAWTAFHDLLPLSGSLSPLTIPRQSQADELHFIGGKDQVVPPALARDYQRRYPQASLRIIDEFNHQCCWETYWPALLNQASSKVEQR